MLLSSPASTTATLFTQESVSSVTPTHQNSKSEQRDSSLAPKEGNNKVNPPVLLHWGMHRDQGSTGLILKFCV